MKKFAKTLMDQRRSRCLPLMFGMLFASFNAAGDWQLVWSDEFDRGELNEQYWNVIHMPDPYNQELQYYPDRPANSQGSNIRVEDGLLIIEARSEDYEHRRYTSGRINTQGKKEFVYGRFESRIRMPAETGMWPAFWLLGGNIGEVGWPACGEIDIMEGKGRLPSWTSGALNHGAGVEQHEVFSDEYELPDGNFSDDWHVFAVEWEPGEIRWYVDDHEFMVQHRPEVGNGSYWPYDNGQSFFVILNLAVGGHFDKPHGPPEVLEPQQLLVDYVRVYSRDQAVK